LLQKTCFSVLVIPGNQDMLAVHVVGGRGLNQAYGLISGYAKSRYLKKNNNRPTLFIGTFSPVDKFVTIEAGLHGEKMDICYTYLPVSEEPMDTPCPVYASSFSGDADFDNDVCSCINHIQGTPNELG